MRAELSPQTKALDAQLAGLQSFVLAPLTTIVEANSRGKEVTHIQAVNAATAAMELVGNASAHISHYRRTKIVSTLNRTLLPLLDEDKNFEGAAPSLFGSQFAQQSKDLVDQVKAMRSSTRYLKNSTQFQTEPSNSGRGYNSRIGRGQGSRRGHYSGPLGWGAQR